MRSTKAKTYLTEEEGGGGGGGIAHLSYVCATSYRRLDEVKTYLTEDGEEEEEGGGGGGEGIAFQGRGLPRRGKAAPKNAI